MSFVYLAVYADGTSYVGQTTIGFDMLEYRYQQYAKKAKSRRPSEQACFALGMPALGVIEYCPPEKLDERERYWIGIHNKDGPNLNMAGFDYEQTPEGKMLAKWEAERDERFQRRVLELVNEAIKLNK